MDACAASAAMSSSKKTGRPVHPVWSHFQRGEKRNRFHYHAFCIYCIERYGADHVPSIRGVSSDMLRHLESCAHCPRKVLEELKEICGQREAQRYDRFLKRKRESELRADETVKQTTGTVSSSAAAAAAVMAVARQGPLASLGAAPPPLLGTPGIARDLQQPATPSLAIPAATVNTTQLSNAADQAQTAIPTDESNELPAITPAGPGDDGTVASSHPLPLPASSLVETSRQQEEPDEEELKLGVVKTLMTSGIPFPNLKNPHLQALLGLLNSGWTPQLLLSVCDEQFLQQSVQKLGASQLTRIKEGMLNSTIKGGLTLSISCWRNLFHHHLVSFNLVNSNGDAAAISVVDMGTVQYNASELEAHLGQVLEGLKQQNINVIGIVADRSVILQAARNVALKTHRSLVVVPCIARHLSDLAGLVATHESCATAVGDAIELASYFWNKRFLRELQELVGDEVTAPVCMDYASRLSWISFVECIESLLRYENAITLMVIMSKSGATNDSVDQGKQEETWIPCKDFVQLVERSTTWDGIHRLRRLLAPISETYHVLNQRKRSSTSSAVNTHGVTLAHVMYQLGRMDLSYRQCLETAPFGSPDVHVAQLLLDAINAAWQQYDFEPMLLAYAFNFHFDTGLLNTDMFPEQLGWSKVAQIFKKTYETWFEGEIPSDDRVHQLVASYGARQFPFDRSTTGDYLDVSSFYSFVSDSHAEMCALCCRLYGIALTSANLARVLRGGIGFVSQVAETMYDAEMALSLLHVGFASSPKHHLKSMLLDAYREASHNDDCCVDPVRTMNVMTSLSHMNESSLSEMFVEPQELVSTREEWEEFCGDWRDAVDETLVKSDGDGRSSVIALGQLFTSDLPSLLAQ